MSAPRICPRCLVRLVASSRHPLGWCPKCGREVRRVGHRKKSVLAVPPEPTDGPTGPGHGSTPPPLPSAGSPLRDGECLAPESWAPVCVRPSPHLPKQRQLGRTPLVLLAGFFATALLAGGLALAFYMTEPAPADAEDPPDRRPIEPVRSAPVSRPPLGPRPPALSLQALREKALRAVYQQEGAEAASEGEGLEAARRIDELVLARLRARGIAPAALCTDAVFVRRVYLDVIGRIPTAQEALEFLEDTDPNRRALLIEHLLSHRDFADYWAMKWCDLLRVKSEFPINLWPNAVQAYHRWIRAAVRENLPYDRFARALLTSSGSNFRDPPVNFYRAVQSKDPKSLAQAAALTFLGVRPEGWPKERWDEMTVFFARVGYKKTSEWKEEIVLFDRTKPLGGVAGSLSPTEYSALLPDGKKVVIQADQDPREVFADWLCTPDNPWFARTIANRAWAWLVGRGIIHEPDDVRPDNPPSNPELLAHLEQELVKAKFDLRQLFRVILNSKTYQASSIPAGEHPEAAALFAYYPIRRLEAEVLIDAICQITQTTERYESPIPEPFTYVPEGHRSVSLADASITSPFLEMFGRPPRDTGLESERNNNFTAAQKLHLLNSTHILRKIEQGPGLQALRGSGKPLRQIADELYLTILSRHPTKEEREAIAEYSQAGAWGRRPILDIAWALLNSAEFLCRH